MSPHFHGNLYLSQAFHTIFAGDYILQTHVGLTTLPAQVTPKEKRSHDRLRRQAFLPLHLLEPLTNQQTDCLF